MGHGYLGDGYGSHGDVGDDDRERERGWPERGWRGDDRHDRAGMFGDWDRNRSSDREPRERYRRGSGEFGDFSGRGRVLSAHPDDHYRSWRDRHMSELDRDYEDYCREREQQFHSEFAQWREQRHGNPQPLRTGMTQSGISHDPSGELQLTTEATQGEAQPDPTANATLGTNSSGRKRG